MTMLITYCIGIEHTTSELFRENPVGVLNSVVWSVKIHSKSSIIYDIYVLQGPLLTAEIS